MDRIVELEVRNSGYIEPTREWIEVAVPHDLFDQVADQIEREPSRYDQATWRSATPDVGGDTFCGSAYCIGGWAAVLVGLKLSWSGTLMAADGRKLCDSNFKDFYDVAPAVGLSAMLLGMEEQAAIALTDGEWCPADGDVPKALRRLQKRAHEVDELTVLDVACVTRCIPFDEEGA